MFKLVNPEEIKSLKDLKEMIESIGKIMRIANLKYHVIIDLQDGFSNLADQKLIDDTMDWCKHNCDGKWEGNGLVFLFELEHDAATFKLRWS